MSRPVFTSNLHGVRLAAGRRIQAGNATDQWRDQGHAVTVCTTRDISQGSVATHLRCGKIISDNITANCLLILTVKLFRKLVNIR